jgi:hypothetical protein
MRPCRACNHDDRDQLDKALARHVPFRALAPRYGLSVAGLHRHKSRHLATIILEARVRHDRVRGDNLLADVWRLVDEADDIKARAEGVGDDRLALKAQAEKRAVFELLARLSGEVAGAGFPRASYPRPILNAALRRT